MDEEEKSNGLSDTGAQGNGGTRGSNYSALTVLGTVVDTALKDMPPQAVIAVVSILSGGAVAALLLVIWLCFTYPDESNNSLVTVLIIPLGELLVRHYLDRERRKKKEEE